MEKRGSSRRTSTTDTGDDDREDDFVWKEILFALVVMKGSWNEKPVATLLERVVFVVAAATYSRTTNFQSGQEHGKFFNVRTVMMHDER
jgi:hypothetical protein